MIAHTNTRYNAYRRLEIDSKVLPAWLDLWVLSTYRYKYNQGLKRNKSSSYVRREERTYLPFLQLLKIAHQFINIGRRVICFYNRRHSSLLPIKNEPLRYTAGHRNDLGDNLFQGPLFFEDENLIRDTAVWPVLRLFP